MKKKIDNLYDVAYLTKTGRLMVAKRISAKNKTEAKAKLKREMRASTSFKSIVTVIEIKSTVVHGIWLDKKA